VGPVRAMGSHCGRERRKAAPKLVFKFYDSCYGGKQSYRSLFLYQSYWCDLSVYASSLFPLEKSIKQFWPHVTLPKRTYCTSSWHGGKLQLSQSAFHNDNWYVEFVVKILTVSILTSSIYNVSLIHRGDPNFNIACGIVVRDSSVV
jgi:hypothetical protein